MSRLIQARGEVWCVFPDELLVQIIRWLDTDTDMDTVCE
jgi:hypothetical protein